MATRNKEVPVAGRKLAQSTSKPLANQIVAGAAINIADDAGVGQEQMGAKDLSIPRISILQDLSPQVKKTEPEFIKGSEAGMICDIVNAKVFSGETGVSIIPVHYRRTNLEWRPRKDGGGFVADHGSDDKILATCVKGEKGGYKTKAGNDVKATAEYFVYLVNPKTGEYTPYVLSMAGSQLKKARRWNTMINQLRVAHPTLAGQTINPAMFYLSYNATTVPEKNDMGSWYGWKIVGTTPTLEIKHGSQIYMAAREFHKQIASGAVTAAAPRESNTDPVPDENAPM